MTAKERRLFAALLGTAFAAVLVPSAIRGFQRLREAEGSIDAYAAALSKMETLDQDTAAAEERIARLREAFGDEALPREDVPFSDFVKEARSRLRVHGIEPLRYQAIGAGKDEAVEFTLRCDAFSLAAFLREVSLKDRNWAISALSIHPDGTGTIVNAAVRIRYAK